MTSKVTPRKELKMLVKILDCKLFLIKILFSNFFSVLLEISPFIRNPIWKVVGLWNRIMRNPFCKRHGVWYSLMNGAAALVDWLCKLHHQKKNEKGNQDMFIDPIVLKDNSCLQRTCSCFMKVKQKQFEFNVLVWCPCLSAQETVIDRD